MKAILVAAGKGTRMLPLTENAPKGMLKILGKPLMHYIFAYLPDEIDEVLMIVGYKGNQLKDYFGKKYKGRRIRYIWQEEQLGTAHALSLCEDYIASGEKFLLVLADDLHSKSALSELIKHPFAVLVHEHEDPGRFGIIIPDSEGNVVEIEEKPKNPKTNLVIIGAYVFDDRIFAYRADANEETGEYYIPDVVRELIKDHKMKVVETDFWHPIGYPEDLKTAEEVLEERE